MNVEKGPWFTAAYTSECSACDGSIHEGDTIRADGYGGYECDDTVAHEPFLEPSPVVEIRLPAESGPMSVPDPFETPESFLSGDDSDDLNVSGQPPARYEYRGEQNLGYLVKDPELGDFRRYKNKNPKGIARVTTFNKAASSTTAITDWKLRNVIVGASMRSDLLLRAHGVDKETPAGKKTLNRLAAELEAVAGAKVGADIGTYLHKFTEHMDAGLTTPDDAPERYQKQLRLYERRLRDAGFEAVPGLIERTTMIREFGGVVGTFDRVMYHRPSGMYVIVDLKTGKTMDYARDETFCQEWIYAHGVNQNGIYDWNTDTWSPLWDGAGVPNSMGPLTQVSETVGLIIHMPVQGDDAGSVFLEEADLVKGARYAQLCYDVRSNVKPKRKLWSWKAPDAEETDWEALFQGARTQQGASALWKQAKAAGISGIRLNELVRIAQESIAGRG